MVHDDFSEMPSLSPLRTDSLLTFLIFMVLSSREIPKPSYYKDCKSDCCRRFCEVSTFFGVKGDLDVYIQLQLFFWPLAMLVDNILFTKLTVEILKIVSLFQFNSL